jgi:hypothetical protein
VSILLILSGPGVFLRAGARLFVKFYSVDRWWWGLLVADRDKQQTLALSID